MKDATLSGKRKYDELSEKNIPFETKRNIHEKKRKFLREKKEKKKQKKTDSTITKKTTNEKERSNIDPFATPTKVNSHSTACTPATSNSLNPVYTFEASGINVYSYAESRAYEILNLKNALNDANFGPNKQVFQRLPRHMRRRAASHDVRRLPKRLRSKAANENVETKKAPSRKYKRKPRNLIKEYNQRSALNAWLETHMWHAKRFKMVDKWGYRVPQKPCDKSFRALYRASAKSCVLQDQSYTEFIKISGSKETILSGFRKLTNPNVIGGLRLDNEKCLSGDCYGEELIYSHDRYPYNVIGTVKFIWADGGGGTMIHSELMVLCHPSIAMQLVHELDVVFNAVKDDTSDKSCLQEEVEMDVNLCISEQSNQNDTAAVINVIHHKLDFNLFSLTGPLSFQILQRALTLTNETESDSGESIWNPSVELRDENCSIHNLVVEDPRFHIPYKKENPLTAGQESCAKNTSKQSPSLCLWNEATRNETKNGKLSDEEINTMRSKQLMPGSSLPVESVKIPIVIMQRPAKSFTLNKKALPAYGDGFDVIVPAGWAMPFWIALVYQGARVGGVESNENIALEATSLHFPTSYPDSKVHEVEAAKCHDEKLQKHYRYPPDKRTNYDKLGFKHPFSTPWSHMVEEWKHIIKTLAPRLNLQQNIQFSKSDQGIYVLREKLLLEQLKATFNGQTDCKDVINNLLNHPNSLIMVSVRPQREGTPFSKATICIPNGQDITLSMLTRGERHEVSELLSEPHHTGYKKLFPYVCKQHDILLPNASIVGRNTRWVIGVVGEGDYSFTKGHGHGVAFVSTVALVYFLSLRRRGRFSKLLFRNIDSFDYLFCNVDVLM